MTCSTAWPATTVVPGLDQPCADDAVDRTDEPCLRAQLGDPGDVGQRALVVAARG
jgi:hypothetical protein